ncbi:hypothetical protein IFR04_012454 [Cadophora malorum]|uniref:Uncharacterized protein n=1 Tax=Cadophora malorum TaxID=108018 RepID=A0A8H7T7H7_9HELO|nr:hypothetical protein IFR04_012454 [Cadophora malorum]
MQISFQVFALALLASSQALTTVITERDEGQLIERNPDPKGGLLKGALGLIAGAAAAGAAAKAGKGAATPAAPATPASGSAAAGSRIRKNRALAKKGKVVKKGDH